MITIEGVAAPDDTVVTATIAGDEYSASTPAAGYGAGSYMLEIKPDEGTTYSEGALVTFKIGAAQVGTESFEAGGNIELNFAIGEGEAEGGLIKTVTVTTLASGAAATVSYDPDTGVLALGIPAGPAGAAGAAGAQGPQGPAGEDAPGGMALPIVALVLAVIAIGVAVMAMRRKV